MSDISWSVPKGKNAKYELSIVGHANPEACAALTALWYSFTAGIERLAKLHPDDIKLWRTVAMGEGVRASRGSAEREDGK